QDQCRRRGVLHALSRGQQRRLRAQRHPRRHLHCAERQPAEPLSRLNRRRARPAAFDVARRAASHAVFRPKEEQGPDNARLRMVGNATEKGTTMRNLFSVVLLPAAALLALGGCANTLPANSSAAVPSSPVVAMPSSHVADGTVISPTPYVAPAPAGTVPVVTSNGAVLNVPAGSSVVTTTTTTGAPGAVTTYAPTQTAGIVPGALPAQL